MGKVTEWCLDVREPHMKVLSTRCSAKLWEQIQIHTWLKGLKEARGISHQNQQSRRCSSHWMDISSPLLLTPPYCTWPWTGRGKGVGAEMRIWPWARLRIKDILSLCSSWQSAIGLPTSPSFRKGRRELKSLKQTHQEHTKNHSSSFFFSKGELFGNHAEAF